VTVNVVAARPLMRRDFFRASEIILSASSLRDRFAGVQAC